MHDERALTVDADLYERYEAATGIDPRLLPMFAATSLVGNLFVALLDATFGGYVANVHVAQRMSLRGERPTAPFDVALSGDVVAMRPLQGGALVCVRYQAFTPGERAVIEIDTLLLASGPFQRAPERVGISPSRLFAPRTFATGERSERVMVDADAARRFGGLIGDQQRVHTDEATARALGFDAPVVHGLYTLAVCATAVLRGVPDDVDVEQVQARFPAPVYPGDALAVEVATSERDLVFAADGPSGRVLRDGVVTTRSHTPIPSPPSTGSVAPVT